MKQQSLQDRFNQSVEKLKEIFVGVAQSLMPVLDALAGVLEIVNLAVKPFTWLMDVAGKFHDYLKPITGIFLSTLAASTILKKNLFQSAISALTTASSLTLGLGMVTILAAVGYGISQMESKASNPKFAKGGIVTKPITNATVGEAGPEAIIPLNSPKADKYLGTDKSNTGESGENSVVKELREIKNILQKTYNLDLTQNSNKSSQTSGTSLAMNIDRLGTTISTNTYKTQ
jgi:hypothetical protein